MSSWTCTRWALCRTTAPRPIRLTLHHADQIRGSDFVPPTRTSTTGFAYSSARLRLVLSRYCLRSDLQRRGRLTYEQASARGLVFTRDDTTTLTIAGRRASLNAPSRPHTAAAIASASCRFSRISRSAIAEGEKARRRVLAAAGPRRAWADGLRHPGRQCIASKWQRGFKGDARDHFRLPVSAATGGRL